MKFDALGLEAFVAVVDSGTFGKAASLLHLSQTGLSHRLKALESQLGARLIERSTRAWSLTPIGEQFYPRAKRLVEELYDSFKDMRAAAVRGIGNVSVASISTTALQVLPQAVFAYSKRFPGNRVRILEMASPAVMEAVLQGKAEFGINVLTRRHPDLHTDAVYEEDYVLVCRDDHPLARRRQAEWRDVDGQSVIALGHGSANGIILNRMFTELGLDIHALHESQRSTSALALAALGLGLAILPRLALHPGMYPRLRAVPLMKPVIKRELALIRRKGVPLSAAAQPLYDELQSAIRALRPRRSRAAASS